MSGSTRLPFSHDPDSQMPTRLAIVRCLSSVRYAIASESLKYPDACDKETQLR